MKCKTLNKKKKKTQNIIFQNKIEFSIVYIHLMTLLYECLQGVYMLN